MFARIAGLVRLRKVHRPGLHPDTGLPDDGTVDPGFGVDEGANVDNSLPPLPNVPDNELPPGPPGIWPPLNPNVPTHPIAPTDPIQPPPGAIWPPISGGGGGKKYVVIAGIPGVGWRYVVVDPNAVWPRPPTVAPQPK
jgi:hypothetical protein